MKRYSTLFKSPELESHHQIQFSVILRAPLFFRGVGLVLCRGYNLHILSSANSHLLMNDNFLILVVHTKHNHLNHWNPWYNGCTYGMLESFTLHHGLQQKPNRSMCHLITIIHWFIQINFPIFIVFSPIFQLLPLLDFLRYLLYSINRRYTISMSLIFVVLFREYICLCLPQDRTNVLLDYVGHRLMRYNVSQMTLLDFDSLDVMWVWHICLFIPSTRPAGLVLCYAMLSM